MSDAGESGYYDDRFENGDFWNGRILEERVRHASEDSPCEHRVHSISHLGVRCSVCGKQLRREDLPEGSYANKLSDEWWKVHGRESD